MMESRFPVSSYKATTFQVLTLHIATTFAWLLNNNVKYIWINLPHLGVSVVAQKYRVIGYNTHEHIQKYGLGSTADRGVPESQY